MNKKTLAVAIVALVLIGASVYWFTTSPSVRSTSETVATTTGTLRTSGEVSRPTPAVGVTEYKGAWFKIAYPTNFVPKAEGEDEASFTSPNGSIQFYVYSPQWSGDPASYLQALPTENSESDTSTSSVTHFTNQYGTFYDKKVTRYVTFVAKDGSYKRSFVSIIAGSVATPNSTDYDSKTHTVFGIKYKDQATYDKYLNDYLAFKKSLIQYAD
jgi:hypothetical protein